MIYILICINFINFINHMKNSKQQLWRNSPCSHAYVTPYFYFQKSERFKRFSIYYRDDVNKKKKIFNDIQKPELLLLKFKKEVEEANSLRFQNQKLYFQEKKDKKAKMKSFQSIQYNNNSKRDLSKEQLITDRLYKLSKPQESDYDRFGFRSTLQKSIKDTASTTPLEHIKDFDQTKTTFFTTARRFDLSRPLNFYPAPNKYSHHVPFVSAKKKFVKRIYKIPKLKTQSQSKDRK